MAADRPTIETYLYAIDSSTASSVSSASTAMPTAMATPTPTPTPTATVITTAGNLAATSSYRAAARYSSSSYLEGSRARAQYKADQILEFFVA
ncbi:hypothetical protein ACRALDRAFT_2022933 [Sodiomyces alcalophilus JCM 7366]|uniref:uncharacterized protein n=1 Tax=Sodiomyces alcalophilus JCM 7366 TaxID=591952 RepID=UPI0039B5C837